MNECHCHRFGYCVKHAERECPDCKHVFESPSYPCRDFDPLIDTPASDWENLHDDKESE